MQWESRRILSVLKWEEDKSFLLYSAHHKGITFSLFDSYLFNSFGSLSLLGSDSDLCYSLVLVFTNCSHEIELKHIWDFLTWLFLDGFLFSFFSSSSSLIIMGLDLVRAVRQKDGRNFVVVSYSYSYSYSSTILYY